MSHEVSAVLAAAAALMAQGQADRALEVLEAEIQRSDQPQLRSYAGEVALRAGQPLRARDHLDIATRQDPENIDLRINLALALIELGEPSRAVDLLQDHATVNPSRALLLNLGRALQDTHRWADAARVLNQILAADPADTEALTNLGTVLRDAGHDLQAVDCFERALVLNPSLKAARDNLSHATLAMGDYRRGFMHFEGRQFKDATGLSAQMARWDGRPMRGLTVHVIAEQGFGDMLMFARFGAVLAERGIDAVLHVHPRLVRLLRRSAGFKEVVAYGRAAIGTLARWIPLMSLPHVLGVTLDALPGIVPYLHADRARAERFTHWLGPRAGLRVGIAWAGNPQSEKDDLRGRSIPLEHFGSLLNINGLQLISLQRQNGLDQVDGVSFSGQLRRPEPELDLGADGFLDTAALISVLDLVVTCDTSVAHLAGGLGKPVWVALHHTADWRWMRQRADSPWYPTMRLFRQTVPADWGGVFATIAQQLARTP